MLRRTRRDDEGFTMLVVMVSAFLVMGLVLVGIAYAGVSVKASRASQDQKQALAAAQAGVEDYLSRLNKCETYYLAPCATSSPNPALTGVGTVPGTTGVDAATYSQRVIMTPLTAGNTTGAVRISVTGTYRGESRTLVADLTRGSFLNYLYYTDYETFSPASTRLLKPATTYTPPADETYTFRVNGVNQNVTLRKGVQYTLLQPSVTDLKDGSGSGTGGGCERYAYSTRVAGQTVAARSTFARQITGGSVPANAFFRPAASGTNGGLAKSSQYASQNTLSNFQCLTINFGATDVFDGEAHSNDAMSFSGSSWFKRKVTTAYAASPPWYGTSSPRTGSGTYQPTTVPRLGMPETADEQADDARANGCFYSGPTTIRFLSGGGYAVRSPRTRAGDLNAGCSTGGANSYLTSEQTVSGPANGVVYVDKLSSAWNCTTGGISFYTVTNDVTDYGTGTGASRNTDCSKGDAFVQGDVSGRYTVVAQHNVVVTGDVKYVGEATGTDVLGLIALNNVAVWHPVSSSGNLNPVPTNRRIDAAIASVGNSFTVFNYNVGDPLGTLLVNGVIIQKFRGPVGSSNNGTIVRGYAKDYRYDERLNKLPPPSFIKPLDDPWVVGARAEVQ